MKRAIAGALGGLLALTAVIATPAVAQQGGAKPAARPAARPAAAAATKVGYVNFQSVLEATPGAAQADSTMRREREQMQAEIARLQASFDSSARALDQSAVVLSPSQREAKQKEVEAQGQKAEQRLQELRQQAARRQAELLGPIEQRAQAAVEAARAEGGFGLILERGSLLAADRSLDITERAIARVKAAGTGAAAPR